MTHNSEREAPKRILGDQRIFQAIFNDLGKNFRHEIVDGRYVYVYDGPDPYELEDSAFPGTVAAILSQRRQVIEEIEANCMFNPECQGCKNNSDACGRAKERYGEK